jgi:hypothetical protein
MRSGRLAALVGAASVAAALAAGCTAPDFEYEATVTFPPSAGPVLLNHQAIQSGAVWAASYATFADAVRDPSIVEIGGRALTIGPDACSAQCRDCAFDRAQLAFSVDGGALAVSGTCGSGEREYTVR